MSQGWGQKQSGWNQQQGGWDDQQGGWGQQQSQLQSGWDQPRGGWGHQQPQAGSDQPQQQGWGRQQQQPGGWNQQGPWSAPFGGGPASGGPNIFNPNDPMTNLVSGAVRGFAMNTGGQFYNTAYNKAWVFNSYVRTFFNVTNDYVKRKLLYIVAPFTKLPEENEYQSTAEFTDIVQQDTQHKKIATPDLYIPLMALITYILLLCLIRGSESESFNPQKFGSYSTNALVGILLELVLFLTNIKTLSTLDLLAYHNYKFVGICLALLTRYLNISILAYLIRIYFSIAASLFMYKTLKSHFQTAAVTVNTNIGLGNLKKDTMLILLSALQVFTFWIILIISL